MSKQYSTTEIYQDTTEFKRKLGWSTEKYLKEQEAPSTPAESAGVLGEV